MQQLFTPWRFQYVSTAATETGCIFCSALENQGSGESLIIHRATLNFVILNRFPYSNGHLMIAPYTHIANPADVEPEIAEEMVRLMQHTIKALREIYHPDGFNVGMNLGKSAGAGVQDHYHLHVLPRWNGDTNFMATLAETRIIPEDFATTIAKLKPYFP
jgi:ATP adenylyltransferase